MIEVSKQPVHSSTYRVMQIQLPFVSYRCKIFILGSPYKMFPSCGNKKNIPTLFPGDILSTKNTTHAKYDSVCVVLQCRLYLVHMYVRGNSKRELFNQLMKYAFAEILAGPVHQQTALSTTALIINRSHYQLVCCYLLLQIVTTTLLTRCLNYLASALRNSTLCLRV